MQSVRDADGTRYLLVKRSSESSLVRDPATGEERHLPNDRLQTEGESPLSAAATGVSNDVRRAVLACRDERALGLLVEFVDRGPLSVRTLLDSYDLCESDLHGVLAEFRAAGLLAETTVAGERGYEPTDEAVTVVDRFRA
ncbi:hypothetical protein Hbl1158_05605 [Halobaculum sp. CBA1158]|uniref:DUF7346 family protein n=1 Tax=Halobaculum sp. CBA1158 TaxID=2904243 RepID=UPI001F19B241|nr:hypothetical protein [Halobaculum sp. CBA1158]UIP00832.1 hypothetical protein Hbl1158_05605 [Halobaculum sp. CBA1158]